MGLRGPESAGSPGPSNQGQHLNFLCWEGAGDAMDVKKKKIKLACWFVLGRVLEILCTAL